MITPFQFLEYCLCVSIAIVVCRLGWIIVEAITGFHNKE